MAIALVVALCLVVMPGGGFPFGRERADSSTRFVAPVLPHDAIPGAPTPAPADSPAVLPVDPRGSAPDVARPISIDGVDLHDGMVTKVGETFYLYGTMYGCGFHWQHVSTPWCGFGVSHAAALSGPWSPPALLFDPAAWQSRCRQDGCFNPRLVDVDGAFRLWFNAPGDFRKHALNAYYTMTCVGPMGPCHTPRKPDLWVCNSNGDATVVVPPTGNPWLFCTRPDLTLGQEQLDATGTTGTGVGSVRLAGATRVEAPGVYFDEGSERWVMTFSSPNCGYCAGTGTAYATAPSIAGPWSHHGHLSQLSCHGQPRTVQVIDGHPYQHIDRWTHGNMNQTAASTVLAPLDAMPCP